MSTLVLRELRWEKVDLELERPLVTSVARYETRQVLLVRATIDIDGHLVEGIGEAAPLVGWTEESVDDCVAGLEQLAMPVALSGVALSGVTALDEALPALKTLPTLRFALELALLDGLSKSSQAELVRWLGLDGAPRDSVKMQWTVGTLGTEETIQSCRQGQALGFRAFKLKVGSAPLDEDVARIEAVRDAFPEALIRLDANGAFSPREARRFLRQIAALEIDFVEQPVCDSAELCEIAKNSPVPVAADESCATFEEALALLESGQVPVLVIKPMALGGLLRAKEIVEAGADSGVRIVLSSLIESSIAREAIISLAAALQLEGPQGLATGHWFREGKIEPGINDRQEHRNWLWEQVQRRPDGLAMIADGRRYTYEELAGEVERRAAILRAQGVGPGSLVGLLAENSPQWVFAAHAVFWLGATLIPLHTRLSSEERRAQLARLGLDLLLVEEGARAPATLALTTLARAPKASCPPASLRLDHVLTILFTSGTMGTPRKVPLTLANHLASARASRERIGQQPEDCWLCCLPLYHVGGLAIVLRSAIYGTSFLLMPHFDAPTVLATLREQPVTLASFVPTMVHRLLDVADGELANGLRVVLVGGGPMQAEELLDARQRGLPVVPTYGMTEAASQLVTLSREEPEERLASAGKALPDVEITIVGPDGTPLPPGEPGMIRVSGPMVTAPGDLLTGDVGYLDEEGYLYIEYRSGELIVTGGENLDPRQVEALLRRHPAVSDVAIVGVDDAEWGQVVAALVVADETIDEEELIPVLTAHCRESVASFKVPRIWAVVDEIPRTVSGKLNREIARRFALDAQQERSR